MISLRANLNGLCCKVRCQTALTNCRNIASSQEYFQHSIRNRLRPASVSKVTTRYSSIESLTDDILRRCPIKVRDACACKICVDPYSGQKNFKTTEIPQNIRAKSTRQIQEGVEIEWTNDIPGLKSHKSFFPKDLSSLRKSQPQLERSLTTVTWDRNILENVLSDLRFEYHAYINDDEVLNKLIKAIQMWGISFLFGVPESEKTVQTIAHRIGPLRNTFYGKTWDVKSINQAKNVAYTDKYLGLHQDLLYMENPPAIQILHCIRNTCEGGNSLFSDAFKAAIQLPVSDYRRLTEEKIYYHYQKDGQNYKCSHLIFEQDPAVKITVPSVVNYSPPFQAPFPINNYDSDITELSQSLDKFVQRVESPENVFECKLRHGECVIFNNRRLLHGRTAFEAKAGERWLKGCYLDYDVFSSRSRAIIET